MKGTRREEFLTAHLILWKICKSVEEKQLSSFILGSLARVNQLRVCAVGVLLL